MSDERQEHTTFQVDVFRHEGGWRCEVSDPIRERSGTGAYAAVEAGDLDTLMRMAVPYLVTVAEPMGALDRLFERARRAPEAESSSVFPDSPFGV